MSFARSACEQVRSRIPGLEVRYVSNGIDISRFNDSLPESPLPEKIKPEWLGKRTLLYIGRLGYEKAVDVAIKAFALCLERNPDAHFIIIGQGPAGEELIGLAESVDTTGHIHMTGMIPNQDLIGSKLLKKISAFVTASLSENQAMTVIEALCSGTPVIAADVANMRALFADEQGWFFEGGSIESLADTMDYVLNHPEERDRKAIEAGKAISRFDGAEVAKKFVSLYEELIEMKKEGFFVPGGEKRAAKYLRKEKRK